MGWARFSVPSKAFILGEYAVLRGAPALVATFGPRFELRREAGAGRKLRDFSPESPVRRFLKSLPTGEDPSLLDAEFLDPHQGTGGFGGSTAEFALAYAAVYSPTCSVTDLWRDYRAIQPEASGADLVAQWSGGAVIVDPVTGKVESLLSERIFRNWFVFSAAHQPGRKVKTYEHLEALKRADLSRLAKSEVLAGGLQAAREGNFDAFARSVNEYAMLLRSLGFELPQTAADRAALRDIPGVCAVKGTGAMQADAIVVFGDPDREFGQIREELLPVASARDLRLVNSGWKEETGIL